MPTPSARAPSAEFRDRAPRFGLITHDPASEPVVLAVFPDDGKRLPGWAKGHFHDGLRPLADGLRQDLPAWQDEWSNSPGSGSSDAPWPQFSLWVGDGQVLAERIHEVGPGYAVHLGVGPRVLRQRRPVHR